MRRTLDTAIATRSVHIAASPLVGHGPTSVAYREVGRGAPAVMFLHGGWGYRFYPIDIQARELAPRHRVLIPDRSGYGRSSQVASLPVDFHRHAMLESLLFLDALGIDKAIWWGHSDGAVIAALAAIERPDRVAAVILEALHLYRHKPRSTSFFEQMAADPDSFGPKITTTLCQDHGERWRDVLRLGGQAWLALAATAMEEHDDLFDRRLATVQAPAMLIHGGRDPRTEPGELAALRSALPQAQVEYYPDAGHCPHSELTTAFPVAQAMCGFIATLPAS